MNNKNILMAAAIFCILPALATDSLAVSRAKAAAQQKVKAQQAQVTAKAASLASAKAQVTAKAAHLASAKAKFTAAKAKFASAESGSTGAQEASTTTTLEATKKAAHAALKKAQQDEREIALKIEVAKYHKKKLETELAANAPSDPKKPATSGKKYKKRTELSAQIATVQSNIQSDEATKIELSKKKKTAKAAYEKAVKAMAKEEHRSTSSTKLQALKAEVAKAKKHEQALKAEVTKRTKALAAARAKLQALQAKERAIKK